MRLMWLSLIVLEKLINLMWMSAWLRSPSASMAS